MGKILLFGILFIIVIIMICFIIYDKKTTNKYGTDDVNYLSCVGGLKRLAGISDCVLVVKNSGLFIDIIEKFQLNIPFNKISDVYVNTETQIKENITLTRMLVFGVFSLGMKKKTEEEKRFLIIEYQDERNESQKIILKGDCFYINQSLLDNIYMGIDKAKA